MSFRSDAEKILKAAIAAAMPDSAVKNALQSIALGSGTVVLIAAGKAAWQMAKAAVDVLGERVVRGVVITKYGYAKGALPRLAVYEAGHPVPDENGFRATQAAIDAVQGLTARDAVLFLLSGGGSALFEKPLIPAEELTRLTDELLSSGADIAGINTVRKRFSAVKGGRFALLCRPAKVFTVALSDVLGDAPDRIASGPTVPDPTTAAEARAVFSRYGLTLTPAMEALLGDETPKSLDNAEIQVTGSVRTLCTAAESVCRSLGYDPLILTDRLSCTARDAGVLLGNLAGTWAGRGKRAFLLGGETVVRVTGSGKGGRNQELALAAAEGLAGLNACVFSVGSDGTDGPTDAAGGLVDGTAAERLRQNGVSLSAALQNNDAYHALAAIDGLLFTGPTGTNVNDLSVLLLGE